MKHTRKSYKIFLFFTALAVANVSLAAFTSPVIDETSKKGLFQLLRIYNPKDQPLVISGGDQRLQVNFVYDANVEPFLSITELVVHPGRAPQHLETDGDFRMSTLDISGREIESVFLDLQKHTIIYGPPNLEGERPAEAGSKVLDYVSFAETMKYSSEVVGVRVTDRDGKVVTSQDLTGISVKPRVLQEWPCDTNLPPYIYKPVSNSGKKEGLLSFLAQKVFAVQGTLYVAIIGDKYTDLNEFNSDANDVIASFLSLSPYKDRAAQIRFNLVNNASDLECQYHPVVTRLLYCNNSLVTSAVNASGVSYDTIVVIVDSSIYGGSGGSIAVTYNGSEMEGVGAHELLGHTFGGLLDAYILYSGNGILDNKTHSLFGDRGNCYAGSPPTSDWPGIPVRDRKSVV